MERNYQVNKIKYFLERDALFWSGTCIRDFYNWSIGMDKFQGFEEGHIYIPKWVLAQGIWQNRGSLRDVIRHEYGHALAHYYPEMIEHSKSFEKIFGGNYYSYVPTQMEREAFISKYASTLPMEDFAETFMVFVRRKGIIPANIINKKLLAKWKFIADLCIKISLK